MLSADRVFCRAISSFRRRVFTSSSTSSGRWRLAYVPGLSLYLNMNALSYLHSLIRLRLIWWSSSVSPQ